VSPGRKVAAAELVNGKAHYVYVAVIAPIHPGRHKTTMLLAGPHTETIAPLRRGGRNGGDLDDPQRHDQGASRP
jgi:hypothetical protein